MDTTRFNEVRERLLSQVYRRTQVVMDEPPDPNQWTDAEMAVLRERGEAMNARGVAVGATINRILRDAEYASRQAVLQMPDVLPPEVRDARLMVRLHQAHFRKIYRGDYTGRCRREGHLPMITVKDLPE